MYGGDKGSNKVIWRGYWWTEKEKPTKTMLGRQHTEGCERDAWYQELEWDSQRQGQLEENVKGCINSKERRLRSTNGLLRQKYLF